jgi:hypothetical protein
MFRPRRYRAVRRRMNQLSAVHARDRFIASTLQPHGRSMRRWGAVKLHFLPPKSEKLHICGPNTDHECIIFSAEFYKNHRLTGGVKYRIHAHELSFHPMKTTLSLDQDIFERLQAEPQRTGRSFKEIVNEHACGHHWRGPEP